MTVQTTIQHRRDTAANWTSTNPTLASGEMGVETDTNKFKIGDGSSTWTALSYQGVGGGSMTQIATGDISSGGGYSLTISSIPQTYKSLQLQLFNVTGDSSVTNMGLQLNGDTNSDYSYTYTLNNSASNSSQFSNQKSLYIGRFGGNYAQSMVMDIPLYTQSSMAKYVSWYSNWQYSTYMYVSMGVGGTTGVTSAVTSITLLSNGISAFTGGTYILYGVK